MEDIVHKLWVLSYLCLRGVGFGRYMKWYLSSLALPSRWWLNLETFNVILTPFVMSKAALVARKLLKWVHAEAN
jgi:hypothetical protein